MRVEQDGPAAWKVVRTDGSVVASGLTHAAAWAIVDRGDGEASEDAERRERISKAIGQW